MATALSQAFGDEGGGGCTQLAPLTSHLLCGARAERAGRAQEVNALNQAFADKEGCRVSGWLDVQRVAGNFHIAVHMEDYVMLDRVRPPTQRGNGSLQQAPAVHERLPAHRPIAGLHPVSSGALAAQLGCWHGSST